MKSYLVFTNKEEHLKQQMIFAQMKGYHTEVLDFVNTNCSTIKWNPFDLIKEKLENQNIKQAIPLVSDIVDTLISDVNNKFYYDMMKVCLMELLLDYLECREVSAWILNDLQLEVNKFVDDHPILDGICEEHKIRINHQLSSQLLNQLEKWKDYNLLANLINLVDEETYQPLPKLCIHQLEESPMVLFVVSDEKVKISQQFSLIFMKQFYSELKDIRMKKNNKELELICRILEIEDYPIINNLLLMIATTKPSEIKFEIGIKDNKKFENNYEENANFIISMLSNNYDIDLKHEFINLDDINDMRL